MAFRRARTTGAVTGTTGEATDNETGIVDALQRGGADARRAVARGVQDHREPALAVPPRRPHLATLHGRLSLLSRLLLRRFARRHPHQRVRRPPGRVPHLRRADRPAAHRAGRPARSPLEHWRHRAERRRRQPPREVPRLRLALPRRGGACRSRQEERRDVLRAAALLAGAYRAGRLARLAQRRAGRAAHQLPAARLADRCRERRAGAGLRRGHPGPGADRSLRRRRHSRIRRRHRRADSEPAHRRLAGLPRAADRGGAARPGGARERRATALRLGDGAREAARRKRAAC